MNKPELLAPAGNFSKLKTAVYYGADAVYIGGKSFSLRALSDNFTDEEIARAVEYAHGKNVKVYVTVNIFAKNSDFDKAKEYFKFLYSVGVDAVLITDIGLIDLCKEVAPKLPIHLSTQANTLNKYAVRAWKNYGLERVVLARELSLAEIADQTGITRQGVRDSIKRCEQQLYDFEKKLGLYKRFCELEKGLEDISATAREIFENSQDNKIKALAGKIKSTADALKE